MPTRRIRLKVAPSSNVRQHAEIDQRRDREDRERFERQEQPKAMLDQVAQP